MGSPAGRDGQRRRRHHQIARTGARTSRNDRARRCCRLAGFIFNYAIFDGSDARQLRRHYERRSRNTRSGRAQERDTPGLDGALPVNVRRLSNGPLMDWFDRRVVEFVQAWAPYGGPREEDVFPLFGMSRMRLLRRFDRIVDRLVRQVDEDPNSVDRELLSHVRAILRTRTLVPSKIPPDSIDSRRGDDRPRGHGIRSGHRFHSTSAKRVQSGAPVSATGSPIRAQPRPSFNYPLG